MPGSDLFQSGTELTQMPGDAALSGVQADFDPANKAPLGALQTTFDRLDTENNQAVQQQKQRDFQAAQRQQEVKNDMLTRQMQWDHEDKLKAYDRSMEARKQLYNLFNQTGATSASLKDENGNDMSIPFLPLDNDRLTKDANEFQKWAYSDPSNNLYSADLSKQMNEQKQKRSNASLRAIYDKQAEHLLAKTFDPQEKERIQKYKDALGQQTVDDMPHPFVELPSIKPLIDVPKEYKDGKGFEDFGEDGSGVPNSRYLGLANTTDPQMINEGYKRFQFFQQNPEGQDAQAYTQWKQKLDKLTEARGLPKFDFGEQITPDGKVVFDGSTIAKQRQIARQFLAATELENNGHLQQPDEETVLKNQKTRAEIDKDRAVAKKDDVEAQIKAHELKTGRSSKPTTEELKQEQSKKAVASMYDQVQEAFKDTDERGQAPQLPEQWQSWWKDRGVDISNYAVYSPPKDVAAKFIGLEADQVTTKTVQRKGETKETTIKGESQKPDNVYLLKDKKTGEKQLVYTKSGKVVSKVSEKQAIINGLKHEAKYDPNRYENQVSWVDDVYNNADKKAEKQTEGSSDNQDSEDVIKARLVPIKVKTKSGGVVTLMKDPKTGKRYNL